MMSMLNAETHDEASPTTDGEVSHERKHDDVGLGYWEVKINFASHRPPNPNIGRDIRTDPELDFFARSGELLRFLKKAEELRNRTREADSHGESEQHRPEFDTTASSPDGAAPSP